MSWFSSQDCTRRQAESYHAAHSVGNDVAPMDHSQDRPVSSINASVEQVGLNALQSSIFTEVAQINLLNISTENKMHKLLIALLPEESRNFTKEELIQLSANFGIGKDRNADVACIKDIRNHLSESPFLTSEQRKPILSSSINGVLQDQILLYLFLKIADRHNLLLLFEDKFKDPTFATQTFPQKVSSVLKYLQDRRQKITSIFYASIYGITGIPSEVYRLTNLKELNVSEYSINALSEEISNLINLQVLDLHDTRIRELPEGVGMLTNLEILNLACWNSLKVLPECIKNLRNLKSLNIGGTGITELPQWISELVNLQELDIGETGITELPPWISNLVNLKELELTYLKIKKLPEALSRLQNFTIVLNSGNQVEIPTSFKGKIRWED